MNPRPTATLRLLRAATVVVILFAIGGTAWLLGTALANPDVQTKQPGWFEGSFEVTYWIPLILTFLLGCVAVAAIYARAAKRLRRGEDLFAKSFREQRRQALEQRRQALERRRQALERRRDQLAQPAER